MSIAAEPPSAGAPGDVLSHLAGARPDSALGALLARRPEIVRYAEGSYMALLEPTELGGVSRSERELVALRVATLTGAPALADWHRARLRTLGVPEETLAAVSGDLDAVTLSAREHAILAHVDRVSRAPATLTPAALAQLSAVDLRPRDIVVLSQLIGFLGFQTRALHGLRLLAEAS